MYKPIAHHVEAASLAATDGISTVGDRLADALAASYGRPTRSVAPRPTSRRQECGTGHIVASFQLRAAGGQEGGQEANIRLLLHGGVV